MPLFTPSHAALCTNAILSSTFRFWPCSVNGIADTVDDTNGVGLSSTVNVLNTLRTRDATK